MIKNLLLITLLLSTLRGFGQDSLWQRTYDFGIYNNFDLRNSSKNAISTHRVLNDGFDKLFASKMNPKAGNISKGIFGFATTYLAMLWSHEFGHSLRAKQVGGQFNIHNFKLPVPYTTVDLPANISLTDEAIFVTAGFEVNYLNIRNLQSQFVRQNGLWNEDLGLSFANRLMYTIYTSMIVPVDPREKNVWIETAGDPVHYILPVFKNYSNNKVFLADSTVNPELVSFYNQARNFGLLFQLLDPNFYREVGATFGNATKIRRPVFLLGDYHNGWTYGTLFNASPLGYELYMQNYIHLKDKQYGLYIKYGRPFKNIGIGLSMNDILSFNKFQSDLLVEMWQQDLFGNGLSAELISRYKMNDSLGLNFHVGYKSAGYVLGKQLNSGMNVGGGIAIYSSWR
ncbi:MAG: hypothetical protein OEY34_02975 [Cyclobacteriaceae bacterium]|nr:hypothetical protein [Cyclobacteriaceae bacterium]